MGFSLSNEQNRIDAFQMKLLGRIRVLPTHIDRSWTNQKVTNTLSERHGYVHAIQTVFKMEEQTIVLLGHVLRAPQNNLMREVLS